MAVRDKEWLTLEACREFQRGTCSRTEQECKYAHPSNSVVVENGRVIACYDSMKVSCRENAFIIKPSPLPPSRPPQLVTSQKFPPTV